MIAPRGNVMLIKILAFNVRRVEKCEEFLLPYRFLCEKIKTFEKWVITISIASKLMWEITKVRAGI